MTDPVTKLQLGAILTQFGGGLALFLYGMRQLTEALKIVAGGGMKSLLAHLTVNRFTASLAGAVITAVIQSSSVTTVLIVGFISAGLLTLNQSIGVILGANVGTTITAQIIAFQIYKYGLLMIAAGFFTEILARRERVRQWGIALMGLGLIFFGMELMSIATGPLRAWPPFIGWMQSMQNPLLAVAVGALFTGIVQSSSATTGVVIVLASQGLISLETGIGLIFGANIGTCVTAFISAIGRPRAALQAAYAHIVFNVGGVLLWVFFIAQFADVIRSISPVAEGLTGIERTSAEVPRQIANAHTLFNVINLFIFIWFTGPIGRLVERLAPAPPVPSGIRPKFLQDMYLEQPALALDQVRSELVRLGELVQSMLDQALHVSTAGTEADIARLEHADDEVDTLYQEIVRYLGRLSQETLITPQPQRLQRYIGVANYLENIGDVIDKDMLTVARKRARQNLVFSPTTIAKLELLDATVRESLRNTLEALESGDKEKVLAVIESKQAVNELVADATSHLAKRLVAAEPNRFEVFRIETDIIENFRRVNNYARRIARLSVSTTTDDTESGSAKE